MYLTKTVILFKHWATLVPLGMSIEDYIKDLGLEHVPEYMIIAYTNNVWWDPESRWRTKIETENLPDWFVNNPKRQEEADRLIQTWHKESLRTGEKINTIEEGEYLLSACDVKIVRGTAYVCINSSTVNMIMENACVVEMSGISHVKLATDNCKIVYMIGYSDLDLIDENAEINVMNASTRIKTMTGKSSIKRVSGHAHIDEMHKESRIEELTENAKIERTYDNSHIQIMNKRASIESVHDNSSIYKMDDEAKVEAILNESIVEEMYGLSEIERASIDTKIENMNERSRVLGAANTIECMRDYSVVVYITKYARIKEIKDNANVITWESEESLPSNFKRFRWKRMLKDREVKEKGEKL